MAGPSMIAASPPSRDPPEPLRGTPTAAPSPQADSSPGAAGRRWTPGARQVMERASTENFPVASRVLARGVRADLLAAVSADSVWIESNSA